MRTFLIIWFGQLVSTFGTYLINFAVGVWAWELTEQVTALALVSIFSQLPALFLTPLTGIIVDRYSRKRLMILGDTMAMLATVAVVILSVSNLLAVWHVYLIGAVIKVFGQLQELAYDASLSQLVAPQNYTRATSLNSSLHYGSMIVAPALAGFLYPYLGLTGMAIIDFGTFLVGILTVILVKIPQPSTSEQPPAPNFWSRFSFGFRHAFTQAGLLWFFVWVGLFTFCHDLGAPLVTPMILSYTDNNTEVLGAIATAAGLGGVIGAVILSTWGGFRSPMRGLLFGFIGAGISKTGFGFGQSVLVWFPAQFVSSLNFPLIESSQTTIILNKVSSPFQGQVFAALSLTKQGISIVVKLLSGLLADNFFKPAMEPGGFLVAIVGGIFGTTSGTGLAIFYVLTSLGILLVGLVGLIHQNLTDLSRYR
ncbi:MAG: MFS transporter [Cyanobacteria bacterium SW_9_44_58]|nr:MAG: MFS transporter [Cyanobacteria bacterium SW_9_44_58]